MLTPDAIAFVRAALPEPPARVLEVGAGAGELAVALRSAGYEVLAIDPEPGGDGVAAVALHELREPEASFDAAVAMLSLHHVEPLAESCRVLGGLVREGGPLVIDEFDVERLDERAAEWWLSRREDVEREPEELVRHMREHLHSLARVRAELAPWFLVGEPVPGPYLYRWHLDVALRGEEEALIAAGALPACGARLVAARRDRGTAGK